MTRLLRTCALLWGLGLAACTAHVPAPEHPPRTDAAAAAQALYEQGSRLARLGDSVRAEQYLAAALREGYDPERVLPQLMRVCLNESRLRAALNHALPYLKKHPDAIWLRYLVATVYLGLEQPFHAREQLLAIEAQTPGNGRTQYLLGQTEWEGFDDPAAAEAHFRQYLRLEPRGQYTGEVEEWLRVHADTPLPSAASARNQLAAPEDASSSSTSLPPPLGAEPSTIRDVRVAPASSDTPSDSRKPVP